MQIIYSLNTLYIYSIDRLQYEQSSGQATRMSHSVCTYSLLGDMLTFDK